MAKNHPERALTIDMTLQGDMLSPPSFWSRARVIWRVLPPGTVPALALATFALLAAAIFLVGLIIVAVPVMLALAIVGLVLRAAATTRAGPPARR